MKVDSHIVSICEDCIKYTLGFVIRRLQISDKTKCEFCGKKKPTFICEVYKEKKG